MRPRCQSGEFRSGPISRVLFPCGGKSLSQGGSHFSGGPITRTFERPTRESYRAGPTREGEFPSALCLALHRVGFA